MSQRRQINREKSFQDRLAEEAQRFREAAEKLPYGTAKELLLRRARQARDRFQDQQLANFAGASTSARSGTTGQSAKLALTPT